MFWMECYAIKALVPAHTPSLDESVLKFALNIESRSYLPIPDKLSWAYLLPGLTSTMPP